MRHTGPTSILVSPATAPAATRSFPPVHARFGPRHFRLPPSRPAEPDIDPNPLVDRLRQFVALGAGDIAAIDALMRVPRSFEAGRTLVHEGCAAAHIILIVDGFACRYKMLVGGRRQILGYLIPGDLCDLNFTLHNRPDHSVALLSDARLVQVPIARVTELIARHPAVGRALALAGLVDAAILREWLLSVGQRDAVQKLGHFFCEMAARMRSIGRVGDDGSFDLPLNQATLGDTVGLTTVHVNRVLQRLRSDGLLMLRQRRLTILDPGRLAALAGFDEYYLHMRDHKG